MIVAIATVVSRFTSIAPLIGRFGSGHSGHGSEIGPSTSRRSQAVFKISVSHVPSDGAAVPAGINERISLAMG